jgi:chromosome segregation ATPase
MYEILKKDDAVVDEMAVAYLAIEEHLKSIETERASVHNEIISCKLSDGCTKKDLSSLKNQYDDLGLDLEACESALKILFERMGEKMPEEFKERRMDAQIEIQNLQGQRDAQMDDLLQAFATYLALRERLTGESFNIKDRAWFSDQPYVKWDTETQSRLRQLIEKTSEMTGQSLQRAIRDRQDEIRHIDGILTPWRPAEAINAVLDQHRDRS